ncbi:hypothetical protein BRC64_05955 [Halobacteriales archaeon QH_10_67_22]|nr:MAG: hypothetical protein BRC64_05955 [Halobacteriales archaeon QH_10_67_22]
MEGSESGAVEQRYGYGGAPVAASSAALAVAAASESEPNDTKSNATGISRAETVEGSLSGAEVDWYAFDAADGETVTVTYETTASSGVSSVALYDAEENFRDQIYASAPSTVELSDSTTEGTNFVQVLNVENGEGDYTIRVDPAGENDSTTPTPTSTPTPTATETPSPTPTPTPTPTPDEQSSYGDGPWTIPGRIEAEDYDTGGPGVAYEDTTEENEGGEYRDGQVDIEETGDDGGGYNIGWTRTGEWTEYTVDAESGTYDVNLRVGSNGGEGRIEVLLGGESLGTIDVPDTGSWQNYETVTISDISIESADEEILRVEAVNNSYTLNWIEFVDVSSTPTPTPTETSTPTPTPTVTLVDDDSYGEQTYGEYGYGGVESSSS